MGWLLLAVLLALVVAVLAIRWLLQPMGPSVDIDALIEAKGARLKFHGHDENLRKRTQERREAAGRMRGRAAQVESGAPVSVLLRRVK
jgi:hypothetical protein